MTRAELIRILSSRYPNYPCAMLENTVKSIFDQLSHALAHNNRIEIRGFGSFSLRYRKPRLARNPKTGEVLTTGHKYSVHFKPGKELRDRVNDAIVEKTD